MKTHLQQFGNSKAILLPTAVLVASGLSDEIEMTVEEGRITLTNAKNSRESWFENYSRQALIGRKDEGLLDALDIDTEEWDW
jgi:antitoxin component of MazEF toxin-antitoxin module